MLTGSCISLKIELQIYLHLFPSLPRSNHCLDNEDNDKDDDDDDNDGNKNSKFTVCWPLF